MDSYHHIWAESSTASDLVLLLSLRLAVTFPTLDQVGFVTFQVYQSVLLSRENGTLDLPWGFLLLQGEEDTLDSP